MPSYEGIHTKKGPIPGPTIAIFGGIHGNERTGILTIDRLIRELEPTAGTVHLVYANPPAIGQGVRLINKNLNRLFIRGQAAEAYEHARAERLMDLLDTCDALLDLHSYHSPLAPASAMPFAICEPECHDIAAQFDLPIVISGFSRTEPGATDGYMHRNGKPGICVELGAIECPEKFLALGLETALRFLQYFGCIEQDIAPTQRAQQRLNAALLYKKRTTDFVLAKKFRSFDQISAGEIIAHDGGAPVRSEHNGIILFPTENNPVGVEAFILASTFGQ